MPLTAGCHQSQMVHRHTLERKLFPTSIFAVHANVQALYRYRSCIAERLIVFCKNVHVCSSKCSAHAGLIQVCTMVLHQVFILSVYMYRYCMT